MDDPLPDNFDAAYRWFCSQLHEINFEEPPLLDEQENEVFSNFFDKVLVEPQPSPMPLFGLNGPTEPFMGTIEHQKGPMDLLRGTPERRRDIMTADQVKHNHLVSERRRRDHVKSQFDEIRSLIPSLQSDATLPRSTILRRIHDYILEIADQNREIRRRLEAIDVDTSEIKPFKPSSPLPDSSSS